MTSPAARFAALADRMLNAIAPSVAIKDAALFAEAEVEREAFARLTSARPTPRGPAERPELATSPPAGSRRPTSLVALSGSQQHSACEEARGAVGAAEATPGNGPDWPTWRTSELLIAGANQSEGRQDFATNSYLAELVPELRDRAAQFQAIND